MKNFHIKLAKRPCSAPDVVNLAQEILHIMAIDVHDAASWDCHQ